MQEERSTVVVFIIITTLFILLLIAFIVFILFLYQRRQLAYRKRVENLKTDFEQTLLSAQLEIKEQTFQHISREIHDNIGLSLTLAKLNLNTINWNNLPRTKEKVSGSVDFISKAMGDLRHISKAMHTDFIGEQGLLKALELEVSKIEKLGIFKVLFLVTGSPVFMETQKELVIFRIIQEVLNNSIKHAKASELCVTLHYLEKQVDIEITDNGKGFDLQPGAPQKNGTGLLNIVKRAAIIKGQCLVNSNPGKGTIITLNIPY